MYPRDELELEPTEADRLTALFVLGLILADVLAHPLGAGIVASELESGAGHP